MYFLISKRGSFLVIFKIIDFFFTALYPGNLALIRSDFGNWIRGQLVISFRNRGVLENTVLSAVGGISVCTDPSDKTCTSCAHSASC